MNSPCGHEDLLTVDPNGIMKEGKGGENSTGRTGSWLLAKITCKSCFASSSSQINLWAWNQLSEKVFHGPQNSQRKWEGSGGNSGCLSKHRERTVYWKWSPQGDNLGSCHCCSHHLASHWDTTWGPWAKKHSSTAGPTKPQLSRALTDLHPWRSDTEGNMLRHLGQEVILSLKIVRYY